MDVTARFLGERTFAHGFNMCRYRAHHAPQTSIDCFCLATLIVSDGSRMFWCLASLRSDLCADVPKLGEEGDVEDVFEVGDAGGATGAVLEADDVLYDFHMTSA